MPVHDYDTFGFEPTTFVSKRGTRYLVGETELEHAIGRGLVRVARRVVET